MIDPIFSALDSIHGQGFVHRDIKPENIFLRDGRDAVLMDFGIAREVDRNTRFTQVGMAIGTPHYMSPEQTRGGVVGPASDVYSLGVVIHEALVGHVPYDARDSFAIAIKHIQEPIPALPGTMQKFQPLLDRAMAKDPGQRYPNFRELKADVGRILRGESLPRQTMDVAVERGKGGTVLLNAVGDSMAGEKRKSSGRWMFFLVAGGLCGLIFFGVYLGARDDFFGFGNRAVGVGGGSGPSSQALTPPVAAPHESQLQPSALQEVLTGKNVAQIPATPSGATEMTPVQPPLAADKEPAPVIDPAAERIKTLTGEWQIIRSQAGVNPVKAAVEALSFINRLVAQNNLSEQERIGISAGSDKIFMAAVDAQIKAGLLLPPARNAASEIIRGWIPIARDKALPEAKIRQVVSFLVAQADEAIDSQRDIDKAKQFLGQADMFASVLPSLATEISAGDVAKSAARIHEFEQQKKEAQQRQEDQAVAARHKLDEAWRQLDSGDPWAAEESAAAAATLGAGQDGLDGVRRAISIAQKDKKRRADELLLKIEEFYSAKRYSQAVEACRDLVNIYPKRFLDLKTCDAATQEKQKLTNAWKTENQGEIQVEKIR